MATQDGKKKCAIPGCTATASIKGLCRRHYNRSLYREKDELPTGDLPGGWPCPICGEKLDSLASHMDRHHGIGLKEFYRDHDIRCRHADCDHLAEKRGLCQTHYKWELEERKGEK